MTERIKIDKRRALDLLRQAVANRGEDYVYGEHFDNNQGCRYVVLGKPACIVGEALSLAGLDLADLLSNGGNTWRIGALIDQHPEHFDVTYGAVRVFEEAQHWQDCGWNWGDAVRRAEQYA